MFTEYPAPSVYQCPLPAGYYTCPATPTANGESTVVVDIGYISSCGCVSIMQCLHVHASIAESNDCVLTWMCVGGQSSTQCVCVCVYP